MPFLTTIFRALRGKLAGTTDHTRAKKLRKRALVVSPGFHALSPVVIDNAPLMDSFPMATPTPTLPPDDTALGTATPARTPEMAVPELSPLPIYQTFTSSQHPSLMLDKRWRDSGQRSGRLARIATISDFHNLGRHNRQSLTRNAVTPMPTDGPPAYDRAVELAKYYRSVLPTFESMWDEEQESQEPQAPQRQERLSVTQDDGAEITIAGPPYSFFERRSDSACKPHSPTSFLQDSPSAHSKQRSDPARKPHCSEASSTTAASGVSDPICCAALAENPLRSQPGASPPVPKPQRQHRHGRMASDSRPDARARNSRAEATDATQARPHPTPARHIGPHAASHIPGIRAHRAGNDTSDTTTPPNGTALSAAATTREQPPPNPPPPHPTPHHPTHPSPPLPTTTTTTPNPPLRALPVTARRQRRVRRRRRSDPNGAGAGTASGHGAQSGAAAGAGHD